MRNAHQECVHERGRKKIKYLLGAERVRFDAQSLTREIEISGVVPHSFTCAHPMPGLVSANKENAAVRTVAMKEAAACGSGGTGVHPPQQGGGGSRSLVM